MASVPMTPKLQRSRRGSNDRALKDPLTKQAPTIKVAVPVTATTADTMQGVDELRPKSKNKRRPLSRQHSYSLSMMQPS